MAGATESVRSTELWVRARDVQWLQADITTVELPARHDLSHDRERDRIARPVRSGGHCCLCCRDDHLDGFGQQFGSEVLRLRSVGERPTMYGFRQAESARSLWSIEAPQTARNGRAIRTPAVVTGPPTHTNRPSIPEALQRC